MHFYELYFSPVIAPKECILVFTAGMHHSKSDTVYNQPVIYKHKRGSRLKNIRIPPLFLRKFAVFHICCTSIELQTVKRIVPPFFYCMCGVRF